MGLNNKNLFLKYTGIFFMIFSIFMDLIAQKKHNISVINNAFVPSSLTINAGDTVIWTNSSGYHNVNGTLESYPSNPESFGNSEGTNWTYSKVFTLEGIYNYHCDPHLDLGMIGLIEVEAINVLTTITIDFKEMTPHIGQNLFIYTYNLDENRKKVDDQTKMIENADFSINITGIEPGQKYDIDFYADLNQNEMYDTPPVDHAWRIKLDNIQSDTTLQFIHNLNFTDINLSTGLDPFEPLKSFLIYPNPSEKEISILYDEFEESKITDITIFNLNGQIVFQNKDVKSNTVNIGKLKKGIYILKLNINGVNAFSKFIKSR